MRTGALDPASSTARSIVRREAGIDRPHEDDCDPLAGETIGDQGRVRVLHERTECFLLLGAGDAALTCRFELGLEAIDVALQALLLGVVHLPAHGDADQDSDQERDEDCRE